MYTISPNLNFNITPNFNIKEFYTREPNANFNHPFNLNLAYALQYLRDKYLPGKIFILSTFRRLEYNKKIGGSSTSRHLKGDAVDFKQEKNTIDENVLNQEKDYLNKTFGITEIIVYDTFIHLACGTKIKPIIIKKKNQILNEFLTTENEQEIQNFNFLYYLILLIPLFYVFKNKKK